MCVSLSLFQSQAIGVSAGRRLHAHLPPFNTFQVEFFSSLPSSLFMLLLRQSVIIIVSVHLCASFFPLSLSSFFFQWWSPPSGISSHPDFLAPRVCVLLITWTSRSTITFTSLCITNGTNEPEEEKKVQQAMINSLPLSLSRLVQITCSSCASSPSSCIFFFSPSASSSPSSSTHRTLSDQVETCATEKVMSSELNNQKNKRKR